jgi:hypothetical protein
MYRFARAEGIALDKLRTRLRKMADEDLLPFGKVARFNAATNHPGKRSSFSWRKHAGNGDGGTPRIWFERDYPYRGRQR